MSTMTIHIPLEPYLAQWFINDCGGSVPVTLGKGSIESKILETYLTKLPADEAPDMGGEDTVAIYIPTFRNRPPEYYNHLPKYAKLALTNKIRNRFDVELWNELHHFGAIFRSQQEELIYAFMEKHGIEIDEKNWNAIAKRYQRQCKLYRDRKYFVNEKTAKKQQKSL